MSTTLHCLTNSLLITDWNEKTRLLPSNPRLGLVAPPRTFPLLNLTSQLRQTGRARQF